MSKVLNYAGTSRVNGKLTFRTASDDKRFMQLVKLGDTDVQLVKINPVTSKSQAAKELLAMNFGDGNAEVDALLLSKAKDDNPFATKPAKKTTVKVKSTKKAPVAVKASSEIELTPKEAARIRAEFNAKLKEAYEAN
jgi:hypothetical protein